MNKKIFTLVALVLVCGSAVVAQLTTRELNQERAAAKKLLTKNTKSDTQSAYDKLLTIYNQRPTVEATLDMANVCEIMRRYPESENYYQQALNSNGGRLAPDATLAYADVLKLNGKFAEARQMYQRYIEVGGNKQEAAIRIAHCDSAAMIAKRIPMYTLALERRISTLRDDFPSAIIDNMLVISTNCDVDYNPANRDEVLATKAALSEDIDEDTSMLIRMRTELDPTDLGNFTKQYPVSGKVAHSMYDGSDFTEDKTPENARIKRSEKMESDSKKALKIMERENKNNDFLNMHLYLTSVEKKENVGNGFLGNFVWTSPIELPPPFNTGQNSASACFTSDGNTMYFSHADLTEDGVMDRNIGLFTSHKSGGQWGPPIPFQYNGRYSITDPCITSDGKTLYFSSNMPGTVGDLDIFCCKLNADGTWSKPENLGRVINTPEREMFPTVDAKDVLYFASDGHPGMGGLDIFKAIGEAGKWTRVENQRRPLNSPFDDFSMVFWPGSVNTGLFASNRTGGYDGDDIYSFVKTSSGEVKPQPVGKPLLIVTVVSINGRDTTPIENMQLSLINLAKKRGLAEVSDGAGRAYFPITQRTTYSLSAQSQGFVPASIDEIKVGAFVKETSAKTKKRKGKAQVKSKVKADNNVYVTLVVRKISTGTTFKVNNVNYDYGSAKLKSAAFRELNKVVKFMELNPTVKIELSSHTDSRGSMATNMKLSQRRSQSCVDYLVKKGIARDRIVAKGYGPTRPLVRNARTERDYARNRRTEVKVLSLE